MLKKSNDQEALPDHPHAIFLAIERHIHKGDFQ